MQSDGTISVFGAAAWQEIGRNSSAPGSAAVCHRKRKVIEVGFAPMKPFILLALLFTAVTAVPARADLLLAEKGKTTWVIVVDPAATAPEIGRASCRERVSLNV